MVLTAKVGDYFSGGVPAHNQFPPANLRSRFRVPQFLPGSAGSSSARRGSGPSAGCRARKEEFGIMHRAQRHSLNAVVIQFVINKALKRDECLSRLAHQVFVVNLHIVRANGLPVAPTLLTIHFQNNPASTRLRRRSQGYGRIQPILFSDAATSLPSRMMWIISASGISFLISGR